MSPHDDAQAWAQTQAMRQEARRLYDLAVVAADPGEGVRRAFTNGQVSGRFDLILAVGKAAVAMARAALEVTSAPKVLIVTNPENAADVPGAKTFIANHPVPDAGGGRAAEAVIAAAEALGPDTRCLALISGGGSALLPAPVAGVTLAEKAAVNSLLLGSGASITDMNLVRQQLSRLKGGGLNAIAAPADVTTLVLSDVVGDDLRVIASGPTVAPIGTRKDAASLLKSLYIWDASPDAVRRHLSRDTVDASPVRPGPIHLIGSNRQSVDAALLGAPAAQIGITDLEGDVDWAAHQIVQAAAAPRGIWITGGETTVVLRGTGRGGRNQELALRVAQLAEAAAWPAPWVFLQAGTDGRDGPTDAAGAIVDHGTMARLRAEGADLPALLANNDSYAALATAGDLLITGGTGTNVADIGVLIRGAP